MPDCDCGEYPEVSFSQLFKPTPLANLHIRWMIRRDMPEVLAIESASFPNPWSEDDFIRVLRQRNVIGLVVEHAELVVGFTLYEISRTDIHILNFAVHPDSRRRGVGAALIAKLRGKLHPQRDRRNKITTEISEYNLDACKFFASQGFKATGIHPDFYEDHPGDAYRFVYRHSAS